MTWELTSEAFDKLLESFDPNRERAAEKYEDTRRMLTRVFSWEGTLFPDELVDEVFNRVAKKLAEGEVIGNLGGYCYRTAINLRFEDSKKPRREELPPDPPDKRKSETEVIEQLAQCQDDCLSKLPTENRAFILEYYQDNGRERINRRQQQCAMSPIRLLLTNGQDLLILDDGNTLPGRRRFNRKKFHRNLQSLPKIVITHRQIMVKFVEGHQHRPLPMAVLKHDAKWAKQLDGLLRIHRSRGIRGPLEGTKVFVLNRRLNFSI